MLIPDINIFVGKKEKKALPYLKRHHFTKIYGYNNTILLNLSPYSGLKIEKYDYLTPMNKFKAVSVNIEHWYVETLC